MKRTLAFGSGATLAAVLFFGWATAASAYIEGDMKGKPERDCYVGLEGYSQSDLTPFGKKGKLAIQCTDCDPSCDLDGESTPNGSCTFSFAVRVNDAGDPQCTPIPLKKIVVKAKTKGTKLLSKNGDFGTLPLDGSSATGSMVNFPVLVKKFGKSNPKPGKGKVIELATKPKDKDKFLFVCNPRPAGEACPTTTCRAPGAGDPTKVTFTNSLGSTSCGGAQVNGQTGVVTWMDGTTPFTGQLFDGSGVLIGNLATSCLYLGGGAATQVPPGGNPDNATDVFAVAGVCPDGTLQLAPDAGSSLKDCTLGPEATSACIQTLPATQSCTVNEDCTAGNPNSGACAPVANCYFGTPLPIANAGLSTCVINAILDGVGGTVDTTTGDIDISMPLQSRVYLTGNGAQPCPTCVNDVCDPNWMTGGSPGDPSPNAGDACVAESSAGVTHDCLPAGIFVGAIPVNLTPLTTGMTMLESSDGGFCPGQVDAGMGMNGVKGAFGIEGARKIVETGSPAGDLSGGSGQAVLASTFCIPPTGNVVIDGAADLPGPGATSLPGTIQLVP